VVDFVEICNVCARRAIIEARIILIRCAVVIYSDLNFGVTFLEHSVVLSTPLKLIYKLFQNLKHLTNERNCIGFKCIRKPAESRLSLTHHTKLLLMQFLL